MHLGNDEIGDLGENFWDFSSSEAGKFTAFATRGYSAHYVGAGRGPGDEPLSSVTVANVFTNMIIFTFCPVRR